MDLTIPARRYPVGIQDFPKLRNGGFVYIDKTDYIWRLAHENGSSFFLNRPRRFGKSMLVSTMQAYFEGRRELFSGTALERMETEWETWPVIRLDLSTVKTRDLDALEARLSDILRNLENEFTDGVRLAETLGGRLQALITHVREQASKQVVVLVDEYDAPLLNVIDDPEQLDAFRQVMREFYIPLKACDADLRFVFLTGITKFSQLSIFSELNNLTNISMDPAYAGICGITADELDSEMGEDVEALAERLSFAPSVARQRLKDYYDGYHFTPDSPDIYNPFSLLSAFARGRIKSFWFGSGTPTVLIDAIRAHGWQLLDLTEVDALEAELDAPTERSVAPTALLYQSGYLTVKAYDEEAGVYTLGIPNVEVSRGLSESLVLHAAPLAQSTHNGFLIKLARAFRAGDLEGALQQMRSYLAGIPYHLGSRDERGFETTFYLIFNLLGIQIDTEFKTASGCVDAVVHTRDTVYVFEFKYGRTAEEALAQIDAKDYPLPFLADGRAVIKVGVNFSPETRTIDGWVIQGGPSRL